MKTIDFEITDGIYVLKDVIVITDEQYASMTDADIESEKKSRWDNFIYAINNPSTVTDESQEEQIGG